ncbi:MAG: hypothetical protein PHG25_01015 [Candidatus Pacebacteria bacterium]|nr:hypothetical protein [Candidatus Paceibacterota bacterium]
MTENSAQMIVEKLEVIINNKINSLDISISKRIDSLENRMDDRFVVLEAKFITRLEKEIGNLADATGKGFAEQDRKIDALRDELKDEMKLGFSLVDHKISSLQEFYASKNAYRFA